MAYIGIARPVIAIYSEESDKVKYSGGIRFGKAIKVEIDPQYEDVSDYGEINDTDEEQEFAYADISLNTDEIPEDAEPMMFGHEERDQKTVSALSDRSRYVGLGVRVRQVKSGQIKYLGIWIHKAKFTEGSSSHETKGDSMNYQTPTTPGKAIPDMNGEWRTKKLFNTAEEADAWIDGIAGIERED